MSVTIELPPELEAQFAADAAGLGISLDKYLLDRLTAKSQPSVPEKRLSTEEWNQLLERAADLVPAHVPPLSDYAVSRESIYSREDEM